MSRTGYGVKQITTLEGIDAIRKRPGMYISSTDIDGVQHLLLEVLSNAIDEYLAGECTKIDVFIGKNNSITVVDNGRGIPFGKQKMEPKLWKIYLLNCIQAQNSHQMARLDTTVPGETARSF